MTAHEPIHFLYCKLWISDCFRSSDVIVITLGRQLSRNKLPNFSGKYMYVHVEIILEPGKIKFLGCHGTPTVTLGQFGQLVK